MRKNGINGIDYDRRITKDVTTTFGLGYSPLEGFQAGAGAYHIIFPENRFRLKWGGRIQYSNGLEKPYEYLSVGRFGQHAYFETTIYGQLIVGIQYRAAKWLGIEIESGYSQDLYGGHLHITPSPFSPDDKIDPSTEEMVRLIAGPGNIGCINLFFAF